MKKLIITSVFLLLLSLSGTTQAVPTMSQWVDIGRQDPLWTPLWVHELGVNPPGAALFPQNELISATDTLTEEISCPENYDPSFGSVLVSITNLTGKAWTSLWYVADPETSLTNDDGWINGGLAFKIDKVGLNQPLVFESMNQDSVFEIGETWDFIIQNYTNQLGLAPSALASVGVPTAGDVLSSGSIIARIPNPICKQCA